MLKNIQVEEAEDSMPEYGLKSLPVFRVREQQMAEIREWEVGKKYMLQIEVEMKSQSEDDGGRMSAEFEIQAYKSDREMSEEEQAEGLSNH